MRNQGKAFFSFLFLLAFLVPTIGETLHQISHGNELHCNEKSVHHFHETEHHCLLCDFSFTSYYSDIFKPEFRAIEFFVLPYKTFSPQSFFLEELTTLALRGPPIC